ncbi:uncharacterized protein LOC127263940 [Andrographis paniculata]|uniref:uncharacterized protein LOC127263940 n=1 Tax=Andrographis paniculata TaxID=175694 RepID=UPI0021E9A192|nr:uncharacterized protein LOC127263940 [Andrographis paniculata]
MNTIFHDLIGQSIEVYIDDVIIKSTDFDTHLVDLKNAFIRLKQYNLKMNPTKCAFGVSARNFPGFLVHEKGIEIDGNKAKAVLTMRSPRSVKEVQSFLEKVNYLRHFISNAAGKLKPITKLLRNKAANFSWGQEQYKALEEIKQTLIKPPVLVPPRGDRPLRLYVANSLDVVSSLLVQEWEDVFACTRLEHYILPRETEVVSKIDLIRLILHRPTMQGRLMKWAIKLAPFALRHRPIKAVKGQVVADLLAEFAGNESLENKLQMEEMTHNSAEYEALILGLEALIAKGVQSVLICGDSQLVINQVLKRIAEVVFEHVPRTKNRLADNLAQSACQQMIRSIDSGTDWRTEIMVYLQSPSFVTHVGVRLKALRLQLIEGILYKRTFEGVSLRCLGPEESIKVMGEICYGVPRMPETWSVKSSVNSRITDDESVLLKNATQKEVIEFVLNYIVYRFGIPHTLTTDQGLMFTGEKFVEFLAEFNIKWHHSSPYYPQANGHCGPTEIVEILLLNFPPYQLTFGQDAVLPAEFVVPSPRVTNTTTCIDEAYAQRMLQQLEEVDTDQLNALDQVIRQSEIRAKYYGERVFLKASAEGDLVWKTILPIYKKVDQLGKWSPNWECPFVIHKVIGNGAFIVINQEGKLVHENINAQYLKMYYPAFSGHCH